MRTRNLLCQLNARAAEVASETRARGERRRERNAMKQEAQSEEQMLFLRKGGRESKQERKRQEKQGGEERKRERKQERERERKKQEQSKTHTDTDTETETQTERETHIPAHDNWDSGANMIVDQVRHIGKSHVLGAASTVGVNQQNVLVLALNKKAVALGVCVSIVLFVVCYLLFAVWLIARVCVSLRRRKKDRRQKTTETEDRGRRLTFSEADRM